MRILVKEDEKGKGKKVEIHEVKDGNAINCLIKKGLAQEATAQNLNLLKGKQDSAQHKIDVERAHAQEIAKGIEGKTVEVKAKAGQNGRLYGTVTAKVDSAMTKQQYKFDVDKKKITISNEIKGFGTFAAEAKLYNGVLAKFTVNVTEG